jgi:hypothetical protein
VTIIDTQGNGSVVTCDSAEGPETVLDGFTITNGYAGYGGGMHNDGSSPTVTNCVLWGDAPNEITGSAADVTYSTVQGGWPGIGNIDADPLFVDPDNGDPRLPLLPKGLMWDNVAAEGKQVAISGCLLRPRFFQQGDWKG